MQIITLYIIIYAALAAAGVIQAPAVIMLLINNARITATSHCGRCRTNRKSCRPCFRISACYINTLAGFLRRFIISLVYLYAAFIRTPYLTRRRPQTTLFFARIPGSLPFYKVLEIRLLYQFYVLEALNRPHFRVCVSRGGFLEITKSDRGPFI